LWRELYEYLQSHAEHGSWRVIEHRRVGGGHFMYKWGKAINHDIRFPGNKTEKKREHNNREGQHTTDRIQ
jgi:hypothetical protein